MGIITSMFAGQSAKISDRHTTDEALEAAKGGSGAKGNRGSCVKQKVQKWTPKYEP